MSEERYIYKTSRAVVRPNTVNQRFVYALESENPEVSLADILRDFLEIMGYSSIFPNFDNIRIGTIHPFAILLAQEVLEQPRKSNVFPSITVADSNASEDVEVLGDDYEALVFTKESIAELGGYRGAGKVFVSDEGWAAVQSHLDTYSTVVGIKRRYHTQHSFDFNIWTENKQVTSFLFDMVCHFVSQKRIDIHESLGIDLASISGRRTGDINLDFGMLLYGANVSVTGSMNHDAVLFDLGVESIAEIDTHALPQYFALQGVV